MDRLWSPWRNAYVSHTGSGERKGVPPELAAWPGGEDKHCVFCNLIASATFAVEQGMAPSEAYRAARIVHRGTHCYICLNAFPYGTGHVLIVPFEHRDSLTSLTDEAVTEIMLLARRTEQVLREVYSPGGINLGMNLGTAAGAGVADHLHLHALPRWVGDTNFMTTVAELRVLPEALEMTWTKLEKAYDF